MTWQTDDMIKRSSVCNCSMFLGRNLIGPLCPHIMLVCPAVTWGLWVAFSCAWWRALKVSCRALCANPVRLSRASCRSQCPNSTRSPSSPPRLTHPHSPPSTGWPFSLLFGQKQNVPVRQLEGMMCCVIPHSSKSGYLVKLSFRSPKWFCGSFACFI